MIKNIYLSLVFGLLCIALPAQTIDSLKIALANTERHHIKSADIYYPELDCAGAIPICAIINESTKQYDGIGYFNEINNVFSSIEGCGILAEKNGAWYKFYITQSGLLGFNIIPIDSLDDYDWELYNLTSHTCNDIYSDTSLWSGCNFSGEVGITGANMDTTGIVNIGNDSPKISVQEGETYYLYISFWSEKVNTYAYNLEYYYQSGYTLDFSASTCGLDSCLTQIITGVSETPNKLKATIFPNPAGNTIAVQLNAITTGQTYKLFVYNSQGMLAKEYAGKGNVDSFDVSALAPGMYSYHILTNSNKTATGRFIKE